MKNVSIAYFPLIPSLALNAKCVTTSGRENIFSRLDMAQVRVT